MVRYGNRRMRIGAYGWLPAVSTVSSPFCCSRGSRGELGAPMARLRQGDLHILAFQPLSHIMVRRRLAARPLENTIYLQEFIRAEIAV